MSKVMLVNVTHMEESRVAVLDDGVLAAYEIETINRTSIKGNIYNAVVESVHPSLEAAFVKLSPDLKGFLPIDEINYKLLPVRNEGRKNGRIGQHLSPGQKIMAQVIREPFSGKPPSVSTFFSLPGRYLVLMPGVDTNGVSRKIEDQGQRDRLLKLLDELSRPEGFGIIIRTAGMGQTKTELQRDLRYLLRLWELIQRGSQATEFPGLVYREADLVIRTIRDHFTPDIGEVWIDSEETHSKALSFMRDVMPSKAKSLRLYTGDRPLFNKFNLEEQIERIYKRCVPLPSGGEIVIDGTEALTAVDVNSARSRKKSDIEENATSTNVEAAAEIARQLRLRDLGGLVVIDFIDMQATRNKTKVEKALKDAMRGDRARYDITKISKLGLMEIARQRIKGAKLAASYATCPTCAGHGLIKNIEAAALAALRKIQGRTIPSAVGLIRISVPPEIANWLLNHKREELLQLERRHSVAVQIAGVESMLRHELKFETELGEKVEQPAASLAKETTPKATPAAPAAPEAKAPAAKAPVAKAPSSDADKPKETEAKPEAPAAATSDAPRKKRRRRRRPKSNNPDSATSPKEKEKDVAPAEHSIPSSICADELMPAAVGAGQKKKSQSDRKPRGSSGRRRRSEPRR
jgi:ribonuclease E